LKIHAFLIDLNPQTSDVLLLKLYMHVQLHTLYKSSGFWLEHAATPINVSLSALAYIYS